LKEKKYFEFYEESESTFGRANGYPLGRKERIRFVKGDKPTREEFVALEWVHYFRLIAPLLSFKELEERKDKYYTEDYRSKIDTCGELAREDIKEVAEMFSLDENRLRKHRIDTFTTAFRFLRKLEDYTDDEKFHKKEDGDLFRIWNPSEEEKLRHTPTRSRGESIILTFPYMTRNSRRSSMKSDIGEMSTVWERYVRELVWYFPNQQKTIQEYMREAGFSANKVYPVEFRFALVFRNAVGRKPETAWLFKGLPSEEEITAFEQRSIRESNEIAAKAKVRYDRRQKQEAEKLAKRKAEEAREAQRREAEIKRREATQARPSEPDKPSTPSNPDNPPKP
jgi:hypothetical protein